MLIACCCTFCYAVRCAHAAIEVRDDRGVKVTLQTPAQRIVTIAPHLAELVYAVGLGNRLIAVGRYTDYPPEAKKLPQVGDAARVDIERIVMLKPDLILAWKSGNQASDVAKLEKLGFSVVVTEAGTVADVGRLMRMLSVLGGNTHTGEAAGAAFDREVSALRTRYSARKPVRVFYELWHQPLMTVSGAHLISDAIGICGGVNVFADASVLVPSVTAEAVLAANPDLVLGGGSINDPAEFSRRWSRFPLRELRAVPHRHLPPDNIQRQSPRVILGARAICGHIDEIRTIRMR